jgi:hypothetical protein
MDTSTLVRNAWLGTVTWLAVLLAFACLPAPARAEPPTGKETPKRPLKAPPNVDTPTKVSLGFYALNLGKINQYDETFDVVGLLTTQWEDRRLAFDPASVGEGVVRYTADAIWVPEITILNAANVQRRSPVQLAVKPDGSVKLIEWVQATVSGSFDLHRFPFDTQSAPLIFEPLSSEVQRLELVDNPGAEGFSKESFTTLSEWDIVGTRSAISTRTAETEDHLAFPRKTFSLDIKRNYGFYIFKVMFPLLLITVISWTAFWLNPTTAFVPQINVGITSMLVAVTFNLTITSSLPKVPYATLMDGFVATCFVFFVCSLLSTVLIHVLLAWKKETLAMGLIRKFRWAFPLAFLVVQGLVISTFVFA